MMIPRLERGPRPTRAPIFGRRRRQCGKRRSALWRKGWKRWWKKEGAMGRKRFDHFKPRSGLNKPNLFATGCHRLPPKSHGKQGVCRGLRPVAGCPLPAKERSRRSALVHHLLNYMCLPSLEVEEIEFSMWRTSRVVRARHDPPCVPQRAARLAAGLPRRATTAPEVGAVLLGLA